MRSVFAGRFPREMAERAEAACAIGSSSASPTSRGIVPLALGGSSLHASIAATRDAAVTQAKSALSDWSHAADRPEATTTPGIRDKRRTRSSCKCPVRYDRRVSQNELTYSIVRYAALALFALIAARSTFRLFARSISTPAFLQALSKLVAAGNFSRAAKLMRAADASTVARLVARGWSLRIPSVAAPRGEQEHFRAAGEPGEPFAVAWKRAMDAAQQSLRMEVMTDLVASSVAGAITATLAIFGATSALHSRSRNIDLVVFGLTIFTVISALRVGFSTLQGLVSARAFCENVRVPLEEMDAQRLEGASIADGVWRGGLRHNGDGTDP
jgi:hypothetical protein